MERRVGSCQLHLPGFYLFAVHLRSGDNDFEICFEKYIFSLCENVFSKTPYRESPKLSQLVDVNRYGMSTRWESFSSHRPHCISAAFLEVGNQRFDLVWLGYPSQILFLLYHFFCLRNYIFFSGGFYYSAHGKPPINPCVICVFYSVAKKSTQKKTPLYSHV